MLKITIQDSAADLRLRLEGRLSGPWVDELRQCWQTASSTTFGRETLLDLTDVDFIDADGRALVSEMHDEGVQIIAVTPLIQSLLQEIPGVTGCDRFEESPPARRPNALVSAQKFRRGWGAI